MSSRVGAATVGVSVFGGTSGGVDALVVPVYSIADMAGVVIASVLVRASRGQDQLASAALFLGSAPFLAFYVFLILNRPQVAVDRTHSAFVVMVKVFSALSDFVTGLFV
jgi:hypothetical protein